MDMTICQIEGSWRVGFSKDCFPRGDVRVILRAWGGRIKFTNPVEEVLDFSEDEDTQWGVGFAWFSKQLKVERFEVEFELDDSGSSTTWRNLERLGWQPTDMKVSTHPNTLRCKGTLPKVGKGISPALREDPGGISSSILFVEGKWKLLSEDETDKRRELLWSFRGNETP